MLMPDKEILPLNIKELLGGTDTYVIPVYQRNYAWEAKEIEQLIQDIVDYSKLHQDKNYYIGTLVVSFSATSEYETIDGQQRLTTLSILSSVLKNEFAVKVNMDWFKQLNLRFASREKSTKSLEAVFNGDIEKNTTEENIKVAYKICKTELSKRANAKDQNENINIEAFAEYLYKFVKILRVTLPAGLDLNHYFEIMNSRGEQLEKHEILKAELMDCFSGFEPIEREKLETCFDIIWEACSNMEKYVQYGFTVDQRQIIFGVNDWNNLMIYSFDDFVEKISPLLKSENVESALDIDAIISGNIKTEQRDEKEDSPDRFNAVVNFQNFLLHVLRVQTAKDEVALDDKRLIDIFKSQIPIQLDERIAFVKKYIYNLLHCKFLFDKYVIKREFTANTDRWSLMSLKWYSVGKIKNGVKYVNTFGTDEGDSYNSDNRRILMLLSMFHTSIPSMSYKYWLNATLYYLFNQLEIDSKRYISFLEHIAKTFVFDNYLAIEPVSYFEMIFNDHFRKRTLKQLDFNKLSYGNLNNNLVFNFIDYLLWLKHKDTDKDIRVKTFEYKFRSSVEHFYPQNPIGDDRKLNEQTLHSFGNLCLISHSDNSKYSNYLPDAKSTHYNNKVDLDSIKQFLMIRQCMATRNWFEPEIKKHHQDMLDLLEENMHSAYQPATKISLAQKWFKEYQVKDKNLLVRTLLCFGDYPIEIGRNRYNFFDLDQARNHSAFKFYDEYVIQNNPQSLLEIIADKLKSEELKKSYRYLFAKYPEVVAYCKTGNFNWFENTEDNLIYLLESSNNTKNVSVELYTYLIKILFKKEFGLDMYINNEGIFIYIGFEDDEYFISSSNDAIIQLCIWNNDGIGLSHWLNLEVPNKRTRNFKGLKLLEEYKWIFTDGYYYRFGKSELFKFDKNVIINLENSLNALKGILKNGFKINLN